MNSLVAPTLVISIAALCPFPLLAADTITTNQLGQGVVFKHYHYDNLDSHHRFEG